MRWKRPAPPRSTTYCMVSRASSTRSTSAIRSAAGAMMACRGSSAERPARRASLLPRLRAPIVHRLGHVGGADVRAAGQIGDGARDLQHPVVGARRQPESRSRLFQQLGAGGVGRAPLVDVGGAQRAVGLALALLLALARGGDALAHRR